ncbi:flagellar biosynthesis anti-sigma factor FlgM [Geomonas paludis]|uniref:Negative regulator of flagellin synthesis n=1 Tax=Geomonas paludis TaxID=2740185 RepID=A0A6V8MSM9_9BACT|nr:flagellar biosynthesis anti-sigma factor FlgM [Geomonas paludis]UPU35285.1 flagellar biosynthesis anti-sigma factor FlgM [Geomonas paludis]GFO63155.1 flagellar biosynthesis anti-sigma factor FlgM [Geomonas paludis]
MKLEELNSNPAVSHLAVVRNDKPEAGDAHADVAAKQQASGDKVELSSYMPVVPTSKQRRDDIRVERVEELRAQIKSGNYEVSSKDLAEKMLSKLVVK